MTNLVRKTITLPKKTYTMSKRVADAERLSFSSYVTNVLEEKLWGHEGSANRLKDETSPLTTMGRLSLGSRKDLLRSNKDPLYKKRSKLYEKRNRKVMGF
jgi:hypothetical protein